MAEVLASLKKIGGNGEQYTETVLWTNSSPTTARSGTNTITLSQPYDTFDLVKIRVAYGNVVGSAEKSFYMKASDLPTNNGEPVLTLNKLNGSGQYAQVRHITSTSNTTINDICDNSSQASYSIILEVVGVKIQ